jgi:hypothetical protein
VIGPGRSDCVNLTRRAAVAPHIVLDEAVLAVLWACLHSKLGVNVALPFHRCTAYGGTPATGSCCHWN